MQRQVDFSEAPCLASGVKTSKFQVLFFFFFKPKEKKGEVIEEANPMSMAVLYTLPH